jgi:glycosyltransferase involved in cell wall biosynthesis
MTDKSICFVIPKWSAYFIGVGGAELQCYYLSEELLKHGWQVEVLMKKTELSKIVHHEFYNGAIRFSFYNHTKFSLANFFTIFSKLLGTRSVYYYNRTDARLLRGTCGLYCTVFKKKKIFALANDADIFSEPLHMKYQPGFKNIKASFRYADAWITEKLISKYIFSADYHITQSFAQSSLLLEKFSIKSQVIRNSFVFQDMDNFPKENIILWISNVRPQKRLELLRDLLNDMTIPGWRVLMIGNYTGYESIIEGITNPCFEALGLLSFPEVLQWLAKSRILINTSSWEGFPNSFIQAWFYKCLVISYEFDPDGLLAEKKLGFVANADFGRFKELITDCAILGNYDSILEKALNFAKNEFNIEQNLNKFLYLLKE